MKLLLAFFFSLAFGEGVLNQMLAPGPLMRGHQELEGQRCLACHELGAGLSEAKCVECHKDIGEARKNKTGFHGLRTESCASCHADHRGRDLDTTEVDVKTFEHARQTGFALDGAHAQLGCRDCHDQTRASARKKTRPKEPHLFGAKSSCASCHEDVHRFEGSFKGKDCASCHRATTWREIHDFNHERDAHYKLEGRHAKTACVDCHQREGRPIYAFPELKIDSCRGCHGNPHLGQLTVLGQQQACTRCHTTENFRERLPFDHASFKLAGAHSELECAACHRPTSERFANGHRKGQFRFADQTCVGCHRDPHRGQLGKSCVDCHSEKSWKTSFDHAKSRFPLRGKHSEVTCTKCHENGRYKGLALDCAGCHKDPHRDGRGNRCESCHMEKSWTATIDFHREFTLTGVHHRLQCAQCHVDGRTLKGLDGRCQACHQKDDVHRGQLPACGDCHRQQTWENPTFKHAMTRFPLRGIHRTLDCAACHARGIYRGLSERCVDCHLGDARGASAHPNPIPGFQNCTGCHNQFTFR